MRPRLHLGCGRERLDGWVNVDRQLVVEARGRGGGGFARPVAAALAEYGRDLGVA